MSSEKSDFANTVLDRIKTAYGFEKDTELADKLDSARNTVSGWRSRGSIPFQLIIEKCSNLDFNLIFSTHKDQEVRTKDYFQSSEQTSAPDAGRREEEVQRLEAKIEALEGVIADMDRRRQQWGRAEEPGFTATGTETEAAAG